MSPRQSPLRASRLQPSPHLRSRRKPGLLEHDAPLTQHYKVRYGLHAEPRRRLRTILRIHLKHNSLPRHLPRQLTDLRCRHPAWCAPCSPEIRQNRNGSLRDNLRERCVVNIQRFIQRRKRRLTRAASASVRKMACRDTVCFSAGWAVTDDAECHADRIVAPSRSPARMLLAGRFPSDRTI